MSELQLQYTEAGKDSTCQAVMKVIQGFGSGEQGKPLVGVDRMHERLRPVERLWLLWRASLGDASG
jgi:hypothetical protein